MHHISNHPYCMAPVELRGIKAQILKLLDKDGIVRICIYYRQLNKVTIRNGYLLHKIDDLFYKKKGVAVFTKIDLICGYQQLKIRTEDISKRTFMICYELYEFLVMLFGLSNAPESFMSLMNGIVKQFLDNFFSLY